MEDSSSLSDTPDILTSRLRLRHLSEEFLTASLREDLSTASNLLGAAVPQEWLEAGDLIAMRLQDCRAQPAYRSWSVRAICPTSEGPMAGYIGFHTRPNPDYLQEWAPGGVELGYTIFSNYRRRGYAQEAIVGMMRWAATVASVETFVVSISPANLPSTALAAKLGFQQVGQHVDDVDGLELIYTLEGDALQNVLQTR